MCGIVGVYVKNGNTLDTRASRVASLALQRMQNRGYEGAGAASSDGTNDQFKMQHSLGLVRTSLSPAICDKLSGHMVIAQTRYSTAGKKRDLNPERNIGPLYADTAGGQIAVVHNGNLKGATRLRDELKSEGSIFRTSTDTEVLLHLLARSGAGTFLERLKKTLPKLPVSFSFVIMTSEGLWAVRDPKAIRPLVLGGNEEMYVVASERTALDILNVPYLREIEGGEILGIGRNGLVRTRFAPEETPRPCIFEYVYFARPDNENGAMMASREEAGRLLARNHSGPKGGIVVGVPDSGLVAASGYAEEMGLRLELALVRDHVESRAFMHPTAEERAQAQLLKHACVRQAVAGKIVTLVDDSMVRGGTSKRIASLLRKCGAKEVHLRIASPMVVHPCYYGIDTPTFDELLAHVFGTETRMAEAVGVDSLEFLTLPELVEAVEKTSGRKSFCTTCFDGKTIHE